MDEPARPRERLAGIVASRPEAAGMVVLLSFAVAVAAVLWRLTPSGTTAVEGPGPATVVALQPATVVVHVTGAVRTPGVVTVDDGARVADVVALAGGATPDADLGQVNLARLVVDGEQVVVPSRRTAGADGVQADAPPSAFRDDGRLDLNLATAQDLESLSGIGPVLAQRIVRHREEYGPFTAPGDLRAVPGIGEKTFQAIADQVAV